jgi:hypothetical protein
VLTPDDERVTTDADLRSDCSRCTGLCCVLLPFQASGGFGVDKPSGVPCLNLADDDGCSIHERLWSTGWPGCVIFECFGAGQLITEQTYAGTSWREVDDLGEMAAVLSATRMLQELRWHLREAVGLDPTSGAAELETELGQLVLGTPVDILTIDVDDIHERVGDVLRRVSADRRRSSDKQRRDLAGRDLRDQDLRGANLRGCLLLAADLRGVDLTSADLLGADLRDADLRGTLLAGALFLSQPQVAAARGDTATTLPGRLVRPRHWTD